MRKLIALVGSTAALLIAGMANAAPVDLIFTQTALGATTWTLTMEGTSSNDVSQVAFIINSTPAGDFAIENTGISPWTTDAVSGFSTKSFGTNTLTIAMVGVGALVPAGVLGTLTAAGLVGCADAYVGCPQFTDYTAVGGTIIAGDGETALANSVRFVAVAPPVPEPAVMVLLGLGVAALGLVRRSA